MSAVDMFALSKRGHESLLSENHNSKRPNIVSKMISKAVIAASVMLATQLEAKELDDKNQPILDDVQTGSLGSSGYSNQPTAESSANSVEAVLGSAKSEFASLSSQATNSSSASLSSGSSSINFASETGLPSDFVTQSIGVSDPAQQTNAIEQSIASFDRGQVISFPNTGSTEQDVITIEGIDGQDGTDGTDGQDGINGVNGTNGADGTDGVDGVNGLSTVYLDGNLFGSDNIIDALIANGFDVQQGPLGSVIITFDPTRSDELIDLLDGFAGDNPIADKPQDGDLPTSDPEHGTTSNTGTEGDDFLVGNEDDNVISGFGGNDSLTGGTGADTLLGGDGVDTADYRNSQDAVHVDLETREALFGDAEGDVLVSIENLAGGDGNDILTGDDGDNRLTGRDGDDILSGGSGNDRLVGGEGVDQLIGGEGDRDAVDYNLAEEAVGVDLLNGGFMGEALGDSYSGVEFIVGSDFHDVLLANDDANRINSGEGCDVLNGRGGDDTLIGGEGGDVLNGGEGADVFIFNDDNGYDIIEDFEAGAGRTDRVWLQEYEFDDFDDVQDAMTQTEDGVVLTMDSGTILFQDLSLADFHTDDFILAQSAF